MDDWMSEEEKGIYGLKEVLFCGTSYLKAHSLGNLCPEFEEAQPTLGQWIGFEPVRLETPRTPKHAWSHCTTSASQTLVKHVKKALYFRPRERSARTSSVVPVIQQARKFDVPLVLW
ncbi:hypothetical protein E2C01_024636 [Portunus trituberculatus]|uniref:Uncharacterized protein n=1 Tax=Portunus trituberculatus TaxID=210409 RepID=A0A5B7EAU5_PORTR|nr:hypothetical protein [Portunus trituberculatus]